MFAALSTGQWTGVVFDLLLADFSASFFKAYSCCTEPYIELLFRVVLCGSSPLYSCLTSPFILQSLASSGCFFFAIAIDAFVHNKSTIKKRAK